MALEDHVHAAVQVAVDVIVQGQHPVRLVRVAPVHQVHVLAGGQQALDGRAVFLDVGHVRAVDQGVDHEQRHRIASHTHRGFVAVEDHLVLSVHGLARGHAGVDTVCVEQIFHPLAQLTAEIQHFLAELLRSDVDV